MGPETIVSPTLLVSSVGEKLSVWCSSAFPCIIYFAWRTIKSGYIYRWSAASANFSRCRQLCIQPPSLRLSAPLSRPWLVLGFNFTHFCQQKRKWVTEKSGWVVWEREAEVSSWNHCCVHLSQDQEPGLFPEAWRNLWHNEIMGTNRSRNFAVEKTFFRED